MKTQACNAVRRGEKSLYLLTVDLGYVYRERVKYNEISAKGIYGMGNKAKYLYRVLGHSPENIVKVPDPSSESIIMVRDRCDRTRSDETFR